MAGLYVDPGYVESGYIEGASIHAQLHKLNGGAWVDLFELDLVPLGGTLVRFHAGTNKLRTSIVWQGNTYQPFPIQAEGFDFNGSGELPRPRLRVANVSGIISALVKEYDDLIGMKLTRKRTMVQYLDDVNFEPARNLLAFTETLANAYWTKTATSIGAKVMSIRGEVTADTIAETAANSTHLIQGQNQAMTSGTVYTFSADLKAGTVSVLQLAFPSTTHGVTAWATFDLAAGKVGSIGPSVSASAETMGNGWVRCKITATATASGSSGPVIFFCNNNPQAARGPSYTGATASTAYASALQMEVGPATNYQAVTGATYVRNPTADPYSFLPDEIYTITQKKSEDRLMVEFEMGSALDLQGVTIPRRQIIATICPWRYRDADTCGYAGGPVADRFDVPTTSLAADNCSHTLNGCKLRFGANSVLPFGGFPAVGLTRQ